jgi:spermidine synthase
VPNRNVRSESGSVHHLLTATLLVSAAAIAYEILLMRVLSIVQWHHFAWMVISLALLGYGASGTAIAVARRWLEKRFDTAFAVSALLFSIAMITGFVLGQRVPFNALEVVWNPRQFLHLAAMYLLFMVPFFFAASCIGLAFSFRKSLIGRIYFFDLLGAGLGAVLIIGALFRLQPPQALILLAALALAASALVGLKSPARRTLIAAQFAWITVLILALPAGRIELRVSEFKGLSQALQVVDSRVLSESSSPLGLLTVVDSPTIPFRHAPVLSFTSRFLPPEQLAVFTDGDSMSVITRYERDADMPGHLADVTAALPFRLMDEPEVLILGAGAGSDVLLALHNGAARVDAVELDPRMTALVRDSFADFSGRVYDDDRVSVHTGEARGFVARSSGHYDLIHIGLLDSFGVSGSGVQALNENYLYTVEAVKRYLEHLEPGGMLAITRWFRVPPRDSLKLTATVIEALRELGVTRPGMQLAVIRSWNTVTLLARNGTFSESDCDSLRSWAHSRSFDTAYYPSMPASEANRYNQLDKPYLYEGIIALLGESSAGFLERYKFHIEPATDNRPYFFHFFKWRVLPEVLALRKRGGASLIEWGYLVLFATLLQAVLAGSLLILLPLARVKRSWPAGIGGRMGAYFFLLGLAFLFIEMAFIQKFILFLSHPLYSVAVVLAGFLVFAGLGSACSTPLAQHFEAKGRSPVRVAVGAIAAITLSYVLLLPVLFEQMIGLEDTIRIEISLALIAPLAFFMGMPFPLGLKRIADQAPDFIPWAWGLNGFASVISAALATLLAIRFGFTAVLLLALLFYTAAVALLRR